MKTGRYQLRAKPVDVGDGFNKPTVGTLLAAEEHGASQYPNEVRYGEEVRHYPPEAMLGAAKAILSWADEHWEEIRLEKPNETEQAAG